ncbi:MAG: hypothetical protein IPF59_14090 [Ignavibacteria bacterium]|nr:hypothetical protein [Ignavibacteria bacterium]
MPLVTEYDLATAPDYLTLDLLAQWYPDQNLRWNRATDRSGNENSPLNRVSVSFNRAFMEFVNGGTERTIYAADFTIGTTSANIRIAAVAAIGADVYVSDRFVISPEVSYAYAFIMSSRVSSWNVNAIRGGVHVAYALVFPTLSLSRR